MAFPTTTLLTDFAGTDENPLSEGGAWAGPIQNGAGQLKRLSNQAVGAGGLFANNSYRVSVSVADVEAYMDVPTVGAGAIVYTRVQNPNNASTATAYLWLYDSTVPAFKWIKFTVGTTFTQIGSNFTTHTLAAGESIGMSVSGTTISGYYQSGGVWTLVDSRTDSSIAGAGSIGAGLRDAAAIGDNFGGGAIGAAAAATGVVVSKLNVIYLRKNG